MLVFVEDLLHHKLIVWLSLSSYIGFAELALKDDLFAVVTNWLVCNVVEAQEILVRSLPNKSLFQEIKETTVVFEDGVG